MSEDLTMSKEQSHLPDILRYLSLIEAKPKKDSKIFLFEGSGKKFIVDGKYIKMLPHEYTYLYQRDEFWMLIDPILQYVLFYAWDKEGYVTTSIGRTNEIGDKMDWDKVETQIYNFFVVNIDSLSESLTVSEDAVKTNRYLQSISNNAHHNAPPKGSSANGNYANSHIQSHPLPYSYDTVEYKNRQVFNEKMFAFIKANMSTKCVDLIEDTFKSFKQDKKFSDIDFYIKGFAAYDKVPALMLLAVLEQTQDICSSLNELTHFSSKVKERFKQAKNIPFLKS
jgi:hypothetical protein